LAASAHVQPRAPCPVNGGALGLIPLGACLARSRSNLLADTAGATYALYMAGHLALRATLHARDVGYLTAHYLASGSLQLSAQAPNGSPLAPAAVALAVFLGERELAVSIHGATWRCLVPIEPAERLGELTVIVAPDAQWAAGGVAWTQ